jgi:ABC-2 type transport system permease protein
MRLWIRQVGYEQRIFWRNRRAAFFTFAFPLIFIILFGILQKGNRYSEMPGIDATQFIIPGLLAYAIVSSTFSQLAIQLARYRDSGVLKRMRGTPLPFFTWLSALIVSSLVVVAVTTVITFAYAGLALGATLPTSTLPGFLATVALGSVAFSALGLALLRVTRNPEAAPIVVNVVVLPLTFISSVWYPSGGPHWLQRVAAALPLQPLADGLQHAFDPRVSGPGFVGTDLRTLAIWGVVGSVLMVRAIRAEVHRD